MLDRQETFDRVMDHLRKQGRPAIHVGTCRYRERGNKCAIGALIPDEEYRRRMEGLGAGATMILDAIPGAGSEDGSFLRALQLIHDGAATDHSEPGSFLEKVESRAAVFAKEHRLDYYAPEELAQ